MSVNPAATIARLAWLAALALCSPGSPRAAPALANALEVRMPAWVARDGVRTPLAAGASLLAGDQLITGDDARVVLRLAEGSELRIGEDATVELSTSEARSGDEAFSKQAGIAVLQGAFRLTSAPSGAKRRDIGIRLSSMTIDASAADVWGKSAADGEIVCLVEGQLGIAPANGAPVRIDQPLGFYLVTRDAAPPRQAETDLGQLALWTAETSVKPGSGVQVAGGRWKLNLLLAANQLTAFNGYQKLRQQGYAVEFFPAGTPQHRLYQVTLSGLASEADAQALVVQFAKWPELTPEVVR